MQANYLDHTAFEDGHNVVNLIIQVPDSRVLLFKPGYTRRVPKIDFEWQLTFSKSLIRGKSNKAALGDLIFAKLGWNKGLLDDVEYVTKFHYTGQSIFVYGLAIDHTIEANLGHGARMFALPWETAVNAVLKREMNFSGQTRAIVDIINTFNRR